MKEKKGKRIWRFMVWDALGEIADVLAEGAKKYAPENWKYVNREDYIDAMFRHLTKWASGEKIDPEFGKSHLAHAGCDLLFLLWFDLQDAKKNAKGGENANDNDRVPEKNT